MSSVHKITRKIIVERLDDFIDTVGTTTNYREGSLRGFAYDYRYILFLRGDNFTKIPIMDNVMVKKRKENFITFGFGFSRIQAS